MIRVLVYLTFLMCISIFGQNNDIGWSISSEKDTIKSSNLKVISEDKTTLIFLTLEFGKTERNRKNIVTKTIK